MSCLSVFQAPDYDARQSSAVWHGSEEERVRVSVSETHIESLFCQKMEGTDAHFTAHSKKVPQILYIMHTHNNFFGVFKCE